MAGRQRHSVNSQNTNRSTNTNSGSNSSSPLVPISSPSQVSSVGQLHHTRQGEYYDSQSTDFQPPKRCPCWPISYKFTCIKSKGAILVLVLNFLVLTCADGAYSILLPSILHDVLQHKPPSVDQAWTKTLVSIIRLLVYLFYPLAGWLADTFFGRYKTIVTSMWIVFFATLMMTVLILLQYVFPEDAHYFHQYIFPFLFVLMTIGLAGFQANVIPFGTDQLQDAPGQELVAFLSWYAWTLFLSRGTVFSYYLECFDADNKLIPSCVHAVCISLALALYFLFQHWLSKEPAGGNPLTTIFQVFNYARKHRYARLRSAFTYWDGELPSRIDFAKMRYGGPFTTDQVENVKTFYRMLYVLFSVIVIFVAIATPSTTIGLLASHMSNKLRNNPPVALCLLQSSLENQLPLLIPVISIPFFHFFVNPFIQNCWPTSLKRIGIGSLVFTAGIFSAFTLDTVGHTLKPGDFPCLFSLNATIASDPIPLDYRFILLPGILYGLAWPVLDIGAYEFICAQAPQNMKGLFFGILYCVFGIGSALGFLILLPFSLNSSINWPISCGFCYYLVNILISLLGFAIFCVVAKCYKQRTRDDPTYGQANVEAYYETSSENGPTG